MTTSTKRRGRAAETPASSSTERKKRTAKSKGVGRGKGRANARPKIHPAASKAARQPVPAAPVPTSSMSEHLGTFRAAYTKVKAANGGTSAHCGDDLASLLSGLGPTEVVALASKLLGLDLAHDYKHLNPGQRRMNAGNRLRGAIRTGTVALSKIEAASKQARAA
jgi:hypothetical protein